MGSTVNKMKYVRFLFYCKLGLNVDYAVSNFYGLGCPNYFYV